MSAETLTPDDLTRILHYLDLPPTPTLPLPFLPFLTKYLPILPPSLLQPFSPLIPPRARSSIPLIKSRRLNYASSSPPPPELQADRGRLRWPLLWERMGGSSLPPPSRGVEEEEKWVEESFLRGKSDRQHVKKLGGFLRGLEEEREWEGVREARRAERRLDVGEEFDVEPDEEDDGPGETALPQGIVDEGNQEEIRRTFEKKLLELFVDGMDTVSYDEIDFTESPGGDPIGSQDKEDAYFDDEEPSRTPNGHEEGKGLLNGSTGGEAPVNEADRTMQNGHGEYDY